MNTPHATWEPGSAELWAYQYVASDSLSHKLAPPPMPVRFSAAAQPHCIAAPGRPAQLKLIARGEKTPGPDAMRDPARRARLLHTFLHHELQAAELMCRAVLAYPTTALAFRRGLLAICQDEIRHMRMYAQHMAELGFGFGDFPVNDWFWQRVPSARGPAEFVATMQLGFEGANLDHTERFALAFERAGDARGAELQRQVGREEIPHVAFGAHWFAQFEGELAFERWIAALPAPLSPMLMRGRPLNLGSRRKAGYSELFLQQLENWAPEPSGGEHAG